MADAAAEKFKVPPQLRQAFAEVYACQGQRAKQWQSMLAKVRSDIEVTTRIAELAEALLPAAQLNNPNARDRLVFCGRYSAKVATPLDTSLKIAAMGLAEAQATAAACSTALGGKLPFTVAQGRFGDEHLACRGAAFPYTPSVSASHGAAVLEARAVESVSGVLGAGELLGYVAMQGGGYVDDIGVWPKFHGQGVASGLLAAAAKLELRTGSASLCLDVRAANVPAIKLYERLGFAFGANAYPGFLDWDGGFEGQADAATVLQKQPPNCDLSKV